MAISVVFNGTTYSIPTTGETGWSALTNYLRDLGLYAQTTSSATQSVRTATSSPITVTTSDYLVISDLSVAGAVAVNLPTGVTGQVFIVLDGKGDAATNNITVSGNSGQTINGAANYVIDANRAGLMFQFDGTEWKISAEFAGANPHFTGMTITSLSTGVVHSSAAGLLSSSLVIDADVSNSAAIAGTKISNTPSGNLAATDVQGALNELQTDVDTRATSSALTAHTGASSGAHAGSAISNTPSGNLAATDVQGALNELQTDVDTRATSSALTTHTGASTGVHGVVGSVVGTSDSQALTNKNLASSTNTLTGATAASFTNSGTVTLPTGSVTLASLTGTEVLTNKDIDGGTAANTRRITIPQNTTSNLNGLTRKKGTIVYDSTTDEVKVDNGSTLFALATTTVATPTAQGTSTSYFATIQSAIKTVSSANYAVLTTDGYSSILVTTGASTRTIDLPAAASNAGREIYISKVDSGAGAITIDPNGSETIDGAATNTLSAQYSFITLVCDGTSWFVKSVSDYKEATGTGATIGTSATQLGTISTPPGEWELSALVSYNGSANNSMTININTTTATFSGSIEGKNLVRAAIYSTLGFGGASIPRYRDRSASNTSWFLNASVNATGDSGANYTLCARRVG